MNGVWALIAAVIAFGITAIMGKWMIPFLHKINFGQTIRDEGPKWHKKKQGTPTMGGIMFIIGILIATVVAVPCYWQISSDNVFQMSETGLMATKIFAGLCLALGYGLIGYLDDYIKVVRKRNLGLTVKQKLILQFLVAAAYLAAIYLSGGTGTTEIPFVGLVDLGWAYWLIAAVLIVGVVNAVNFTDGIDGLNGSVTFFFAVFCMVISSYLSMFGLSIMAAAVAGGPADYGFGAEAAARQVDGVDFLPLQLEWYDLVLPTARRDEPAFRAVLDFVTSAQFRRELARTGHYDLSQTGRIFEL